MTVTPAPVLAFDVGGTTVKGALLTGDGQVIEQGRLPSRRGEALLDVLTELADQLVSRGGLTPTAAGVLIPGLVDPVGGRSIRSINLDLTDMPIAEPLAERLGLPVRLDHDVTAAARLIAREDPAPDPVVLVIGTGIASVTFVDGAVVGGRSGQAGELGHFSVDPAGPECGCGQRGCLEVMASAAAIAAAYRARTGRAVAGAHEVAARIDGDPDAAQVWEDAMTALARGVLAAAALLAPGAVLIGGGLSEAGSALTDSLDRHLVRMAGVLPIPPVRCSPLGERAGLLAAAELAQGSTAAGVEARP